MDEQLKYITLINPFYSLKKTKRMKKFFYLAAFAAVATLVSCSSDEIVVSQHDEVTNEDLVPVVLGLGNPSMTVMTRGTGTIGGFAENNHWHGERVRVLMTQIPDDIYPSFGYTQRPVGGEDVKLFDNTFYCLPDEAQANTTGAAYLVAKGVDTRYYPTTGCSNFFAYYIDDAVNPDNGLEQTVFGEADVAALTKDAVTEGEEPMAYKYVDFQLDGSQDVMAGMAAHKSAFPDGFSAKSARHDVHPEITMDHLLTRLTFSVVAGNVNANGVAVTDIAVSSKSVGQLMVAYDANTPQSPDNLITWDETVDPALFHLQERAKDGGGEPIFVDGSGEKTPLQPLSPYTFELDPSYKYEDGVPQPIGDALFVAPGEESYDLIVQTAYSQDGYEADPIPLKITLPSGNALARGSSYNVTIVVYGLSEVLVYATLTPWDEGEEIPRLNEDPFEPIVNFDENGVADLTKFLVEDADAVTYNAETFTMETTEALKGIMISAAEDDNVSGQQLRVTFADDAQVKVTVTYSDDTEASVTMDEAAAIVNLALDGEKTVSKIQIQPTAPTTLTLSEVKVIAEP